MRAVERSLGWMVGCALTLLVSASGCMSSNNAQSNTHSEPDGAAPTAPDGDAASDEAGGAMDGDLWELLQIDGNWAEFQPTLAELARSSDVVVHGRLLAVLDGQTIQGDAPEDVVAEAVLRVEVTEVLWGELAADALEFSLVLRLPVAEVQQAALPEGTVLVFARRRDDGPADYRLVNGYGLWATTARAEIDAPIEVNPASEGVYGDELGGFDSFDGFVDFLRQELE